LPYVSWGEAARRCRNGVSRRGTKVVILTRIYFGLEFPGIFTLLTENYFGMFVLTYVTCQPQLLHPSLGWTTRNRRHKRPRRADICRRSAGSRSLTDSLRVRSHRRPDHRRRGVHLGPRRRWPPRSWRQRLEVCAPYRPVSLWTSRNPGYLRILPHRRGRFQRRSFHLGRGHVRQAGARERVGPFHAPPR